MDLGTKRARTSLVALALASIVAGGCSGTSGEEPVVEESTGELNNGTFRWQCVDASDPTCGTGVFPRAVAVESLFDLSFTPDPDLPDEVELYSIESVSERRIDVDGDDFLVREAGEVSLLATGDGYGVDYIVLEGHPIDRFVLRNADGEQDALGPIHDPLAQVGAITDVEALPYHGNLSLAGALVYEWESLTPDVVDLVRFGGNEATLRGLRVGTARLMVRAGGFSEIIEISVVEAPPEPEPDPTTGGWDGSGSDSGSGSGSDGGSGSTGDSEGGSSSTGGAE